MLTLFISGIPATGKTTLGNFLQDKHNFTHLDLTYPEKSEIQPEEIKELQDKLNTFQRSDKDLVITWGFGPQILPHQEAVKLILDQGAKMIWLDGNQETAIAVFMKRGGMSENSFNQQMDQISNVDIVGKYNSLIINVFDVNGKFRNIKEIAEEILA